MNRPLEFGSVQSLLAHHAQGGAPWIVRPENAEKNSRATITTFDAALDAALRCGGLLGALHSRGLPVVLIFENSVEFVTAFFGVLLAGMIPTPFPPPNFAAGRTDEYGKRLQRVVRDCGPEVILVDSDRNRRQAGDLPGIQVLTLDELLAKSATSAPPHWGTPSDTALIQYTSGSTGDPRGVEITQGNLLANVEAIGLGVGISQNDVGASWLPLFHDMGLIGSLLFSMAWGMKYVMLTPREFLLRPASWLWAISRFGVTLSPAPNFGFRLCTSRVKQEALRGLDLSSWRVAFNGAEAVDMTTVGEFVGRFEAFGLRRDVIWPVYGLAENALAATFPVAAAPLVVDRVCRRTLEREGRAVITEGAVVTRDIVSVGQALPGQRVRVTSGAETVVDRNVGDIEIAGPCVMKGYYRDAGRTEEAITPDGWLRTGDRGYLVDGQLYITGRTKDVIKRHGTVLDAADVERIALQAPGVRDGRVVAFGVHEPGTGESLVLAVELEPKTAEEERLVKSALIAAVMHGCDARPDQIVFVKPGVLPRTTSGKVRRSEARSLYLDGAFAPCGPQARLGV